MPSGIKIFLRFFILILVFLTSSADAQTVENSPPPASTQAPTPAPSGQEPARESVSVAKDLGWNFKGELVFDVKAIQKPTGQAGIAAFQIPWFTLSASRKFSDDTELIIQGLVITPTTGTTDLSFRQVAVRVPKVIGESTGLEVGLIGHALFSSQESFWFTRRIGPEFAFPLHRYGYLPETDYGFQLNSNWGETWSTAVTMTNGEGRGKAETGTRKDLALSIARKWTDGDRAFLLSLFGSRGAFENLPADNNLRDRTQIQLATTKIDGFSLAAEYNWSWDPADGLHNTAADQVNLASFAGTRVAGIGYAGLVNFGWKSNSGSLWSMFSRLDRWEPIKGDGNYAINSSQLGVGYKPRAMIQWYLYNSLTSYGQSHSTAARDQQSWRITLDLKFE